MTVCICSTLFAGCRSKEESNTAERHYYSIDTSQDRSADADKLKDLWIDELNNTFKDDHFEYKETFYGSIDGSYVIIHAQSEKYPDQDVVICEENPLLGSNGKLRTNYNAVRYAKNMEEYLNGGFERRRSVDR